jgi:hypothetical protein
LRKIEIKGAAGWTGDQTVEVGMAQKKSAPAKSEPREMLLVQSKVKDYVREQDLNVAGDLLDALNVEVYTLLDKAGKRAKENGRKTARASDV